MQYSLRSLQSHPDDPQSIQLCRVNRLCQATAPDGRWQRALQILSSGTRLNWERHGPQVIRAIRYLHAIHTKDSSQRLQDLADTDPVLLEVMKLHHGDSLRVLELECRILARQSSAEIAYELKTEPEVIELFHDLFYDIRPSLDPLNDHIHQHVIGMSLFDPSPIEAYARLTAYRNGPGTIPAWLDYLPHRHEEHDLNTPLGRQRESIAQYLAAESLLHTPSPDHAAIPYLDEIQFHFTRPPIPRSVATIIRDHTHALLREKPPELEMNPDVVPFTPSSPQQLVPLTA